MLLSYAAAFHTRLGSFPTRRSSKLGTGRPQGRSMDPSCGVAGFCPAVQRPAGRRDPVERQDKIQIGSTRLNSSHSQTSYAVFCLKKKKQKAQHTNTQTSSNSTFPAA